jgi:hypothetical protein
MHPTAVQPQFAIHNEFHAVGICQSIFGTGALELGSTESCRCNPLLRRRWGNETLQALRKITFIDYGSMMENWYVMDMLVDHWRLDNIDNNKGGMPLSSDDKDVGIKVVLSCNKN